AGRAQLSGFAGGSNKAMDAEQWQIAPYTEADLQKQIDYAPVVYGQEGLQLQHDLADYVAGINQYISEARTDPNKMPSEYAALQQPLNDWQGTDVLVSAAKSQSGHPVVVMGPQVAYFMPEILMEEDLHGPGFDARGATFPGVNLYVQLGHGDDYAWSATSAGQDIIDTFAEKLCEPDGSQ